MPSTAGHIERDTPLTLQARETEQPMSFERNIPTA
jgi:hypothetical protein